MRQALLGRDHRETATNMGDLGLLLWERGDLAGAEPLLRGSLEISRRVLGNQHPNVSSGLSNLGLVVAERGDHAAAVPLFEEALAIRRRALGSSHAGLAIPLNNLAFPLRELKRYDEAIAAMDEAIAIAIPAQGEDSPPVAHYRVNLARVYLAKGDAVRAEPLLRRALQVRLKAYAPDDWRTAMTKSLLGSALTSLRQFPEAESLLLEAKRILKDVPGPQGREARATVARLEALHAARPAEAAARERQ